MSSEKLKKQEAIFIIDLGGDWTISVPETDLALELLDRPPTEIKLTFDKCSTRLLFVYEQTYTT